MTLRSACPPPFLVRFESPAKLALEIPGQHNIWAHDYDGWNSGTLSNFTLIITLSKASSLLHRYLRLAAFKINVPGLLRTDKRGQICINMYSYKLVSRPPLQAKCMALQILAATEGWASGKFGTKEGLESMDAISLLLWWILLVLRSSSLGIPMKTVLFRKESFMECGWIPSSVLITCSLK